MSTSLSEVLLRVAAAIAPDGGDSVRAALEGVLRDAAPFEAGEVAFVGARGDAWRQPLGAVEGPILGEDLLAHVVAHGAAYRIDDWRDAEGFAETLGILHERALRSLLVVPFRFAEPGGAPLAGAMAVGRSHGWAFVGASLPLLVPLAAMAGLALDRARVLTRLRERAADAPASESAAEVKARLGLLIEQAQQAAIDRERERDQARDETGVLRGEAETAARALREESAKSGDLSSRAEAAEARRREAEGSRDEWARKAASLQTRTDELDAEIGSLRQGLAGAHETVAAAGVRAEAGQARLRELQEQVEACQATIGALEDKARGREDETHRLDDAAPKIASLEHQLGRALEIQQRLERERSDLEARLDEMAERLGSLERDRQASASARDESEAARAQIVLETARLEAEHLRLAGELKEAKAELGIALDQIGALSVPATPTPSRGSRGGRKPRGGGP